MKTSKLVLCSVFAALTAVFSQIAIPIGPVPINLATLSVFFAGAVLGPRYGALSQAAFLLLGAVGVPVFSLFRGGVGMLVGPTGGYIAGYVLTAFVVGILCEQFGGGVARLVLYMTAGMAACYLCGTLWFMLLTKTDLWQSLIVCVFPFIPGDLLKALLASALTERIRPALAR